MQQTVESIVQLTRHRRDAVALALSELLEKLTKVRPFRRYYHWSACLYDVL
jgi:hypothetical protein